MAKANKSSDVGVDELEESYKRKIDLALQRQGIRGKAREKLVRWREEGVREMRPKPEYPNAVSELYTEIRRLMESFRGRPTKAEISGVLAETARLRENGLSWLQIAQRLCRDRSPNHICDRKCADRIRVATQSLAKAK